MLPRCADSLRGAAHELVIVDNSVDAAEAEYLQALAKARPNTQLIINSTNVGFARAVNQGVKASTGAALLLLNPDAYLLGDALGVLSKALAQDGVAAVGPLLQYPDGTEQSGGRRLTPTPRRAFGKFFGLSRVGLMKDHNLSGTRLPDTPVEVEALSGACMLVRRDLYCQLNGLDEAYTMHCEDLDLCMRLRLAGYKLHFVPQAVVVHSKGYSSKRQPLWVAWHLHRGMLRYYQKFFRSSYPPVLWYMVVLGVYARFLGVSVISLLGKLRT